VLHRKLLLDRLAAAHPGAAIRSARVVRAPGRVNLIGEHTDYNEGLVLPVAIDLETWVAAAPSPDRRVELVLADGSRDGFDLDAVPAARGGWIDTVCGIACQLLALKVPMRGIRGVVASEIPIGSGLSSSAALQLAAAWAMVADTPPLEPMELALAAARAENEYLGLRSGVMDQFASAHGRTDAALLLDCRSGEYRPVPLPLGTHALVVFDTRSPRRLEGSEYNERRAQCEAAVAALSRVRPGVRSLRDVDADLLDRFSDRIDPVALRRARHVVAENARVGLTVAALDAGKLEPLGALWAESHRSLRDLYGVTSPELDALVELAAATPGVVASRMTGAGFGGCTVSLVERGAVDALEAGVRAGYAERFGREPGVYRVEPAPGAGLVAA
jgi:galactokinase